MNSKKIYNNQVYDDIKAYPFPWYHLANFETSLTDVSPGTHVPSSLSNTDYTLCDNYVGTVSAWTTVDITCQTSHPRGLFLFVIRRIFNGHLQLFEVEICTNFPSLSQTAQRGADAGVYRGLWVVD